MLSEMYRYATKQRDAGPVDHLALSLELLIANKYLTNVWQFCRMTLLWCLACDPATQVNSTWPFLRG